MLILHEKMDLWVALGDDRLSMRKVSIKKYSMRKFLNELHWMMIDYLKYSNQILIYS